MSKIDEEALDWVVRQSSGDLDEADQLAFEAWYDAVPRHQGAYLRAQAIWRSLDTTTIQSNLRPKTLEGDTKKRRNHSRRNLLAGGVAAAAVAGITAAFVVPQMARKVLKTATGEMRKVPLPDRTLASLNSASQVEFSMTPKLRRVVLLKGEALFEVAKNPDQPFVVEAGNIHVRAVGTAFSVRRRDGGADVMVTEGVVEAWAEGAAAERQKLIAGQESFISETAEVITVSSAPQEVERKLAWRDGKVILNNQTLSEAVDEFNRYNAVQIVIADPSIRERRFVGQYRIDQPEDFADTVRSLLDVPVSVDADSIRLGASKPVEKN